MNLSGQKFAIAGMGVSGLAMARAVKVYGGEATVFDQKQNDNTVVLAAVDTLDAQGITAVTGWHGRIDPNEFDSMLVSPGFPRNHPAIRDMLEGKKEILSEVEFAYRISKAPILAITGTNGKSTTTALLWSLLTAAGQSTLLCGNIAGSGFAERPLTEAALLATESDVLAAEISSYQLEWVKEFRPHVAAITNISPDHMDRYSSFDDYYFTKLRLFGAMSSTDSIVLNLDEPSLSRETVSSKNPGDAVIVGFSPKGHQPSEGASRRDSNTLVLSGLEIAIDDLPLLGEHNIANAMMAWEMASQITILSQSSLEALRTFRGLANRMERLGSKNGVLVVNNSMCTNPAAVIASCRSLKGRLHLLMGGVTKNLDFSPVGTFLNEVGHKVYLFGPEPDQMNRMLGREWPHFDTMTQAFESATTSAQPGESVILSPGCASAEPFLNFKERGDAFREIAMDWLGK